MSDYFTERQKLQHRLVGISQGVELEIKDALENALADVSGKIIALEAKASQTASMVAKKKYLVAQKAEIEKVLNEVYKGIGQEIKSKSIEVAQAAPAITISILDQTLGITLGQPKLTKEQVTAWFESSQIEGQFFADYLKKLEANAAARIVKETRQAMLLNESIKQAGKRLQTALEIGRHSAGALAQTSIFSAFNYAEMETYRQDGIKKVRWQCEMDKLTCALCYPHDLQIFTIEEAPPLPVHQRCRCIYDPVFGPDDLKAGNRIARLDAGHRTVHHRDGTTSTVHTDRTVQFVPAKTTYTEWMQGLATSENPKDRAFVREALGPKRAELLADGKLKVSQLTYAGKLRTLDELKKFY
jgi:SPP1 gp7 family putative phage head morphogenesis protein